MEVKRGDGAASTSTTALDYLRVHFVSIVVAILVCGWFAYTRVRFGTWDPSAHFAWWYRGLQLTSIGMDGPIRFGRDIQRLPFKIGQTTYDDGLSVTPFSRLVFRSNAPFTRISGRCGMSSYACAEELASAVCQVIVDGKVVFHSGIVSRGEEAVAFSLELTPTTEFQLVSHEITNPKSCSRINWVDLRVEP